ncbi:lysophospholipase L1-like esterase [Hamadaea flava]|uniref:LamG-like jellyroll fold domain-containing protein n=1 Tax=Hamadaea flava TaxID=1742688 RepID=A0ABV8M010_9ACTN|nr:LamG-like jellyroll fold domain-containing protein [Hamadaea flava]MCP2323522.1 lysophospholipase L1-like esterase [Hamadaea flava]
MAAAVAVVVSGLASQPASATVAPQGTGAGFRYGDNGRLVSAEFGWDGDRSGLLRARGAEQGPWEGWRTIDLGFGEVALQSTVDGLYVSAELGWDGDGYGRLRARATAIGPWERFGVVEMSPGEFAIQSTANDLFVSAELGWSGDDYGILRAISPSPRSSELFVDSTPAPDNVRGSVVDATTTYLAWHDYSRATVRFEIDDGNISRLTDIGSTSFTWTGEVPGSSLCFRIRAVSTSSGERSLWSDPVCTTTPIPVATEVTAAPVDSHVAHVTWADHTGHQLRYAITDGLTVYTTDVGATRFDWAGLAAGQYACFAVAAFNGRNVAEWSDWGCTATVALPAPTVTATGVSTSTTRIRWSGNYAGLDHWEITNGNVDRPINAGASSYDWGGQTAGQYQCFAIRAVVVDGGVSEWSPWQCTVTPVPGPDNVRASVLSAGTARITWNDTSSGVAGFQIDNGNTSRTVSSGATSYDWGEQLPGQRMCYRVRATHDFGASDWSPWTCTTMPVDTPAGVTANATSTHTVLITWNDVPGARFVVTDGTTSSAELPAGTTSYTWTGLAPNQAACFTVAARQNEGQSAWSAKACATTWSLAAPTLVTAIAIDPTTLEVRWPDPAAASVRYEVTDGAGLHTTDPAATSDQWTGLAPGTRRCFQVRAVDGTSHSDWRPSSPTAVCATTPAADAVPPSPATAVTATPDSSQMIHLSWTNPTAGARYEVSNGTASMFTPSDATFFDWGGLNPQTTSCFRVRALTTSGASAWAPDTLPSACATTSAKSCQATNDLPDTGGTVDLYHGTSQAYAQDIRDHGIDIAKGERYVDFGRGFYLTTDLAQARAWAERNFADDHPTVLHFRVPLNALSPGGLCGMVFNPPAAGTPGYLAYVRAMRTFQPLVGGADYDFVEGPLLDNPFDFISGTADARYHGHQDSFHSPQAISLLNQSLSETIPVEQLRPYAIVGDSYSAGQGTANYDPGTDTATNRCHRSAQAPGRLYAAGPPQKYRPESIAHLACTSATIANLTVLGQYGEPAQISAIPADASLITVTIGGNDAGFADVLTRCVLAQASRTACEDYYSQNDTNNLERKINLLLPALAATYTAIKNQAPTARVIAVTYPNLFKPGSDGASQSCAGIGFISSSDISWLIHETLHLDNVIATAAKAAGVEVLDERWVFQGHELCTSTAWVNSLTSQPLTDLSESFHPNASGYARIAEDLAGKASQPPAADPSPTFWHWDNRRNSVMPRLADARMMAASLPVATPVTTPPYREGLFGGWEGDPDRACPVNDVVMARDAWTGPGSLPLQFSSSYPVAGCYVVKGTWISPYDAAGISASNRTEITGNPALGIAARLQIDHVIAQKNAWIMGAWSWTATQRADFFNDYDGLELLVVSGSSNGSKGDRTIDAWTPPNAGFLCDYAIIYATVKYQYGIATTTPEKDRLLDILNNRCTPEAVDPPGQPDGHWLADEASGTTLADSSGHGHPITLTGATWTQGRTGGADSAISVDGSATTNSTAAPVIRTDRSFSVAAWVRYTADGNWRTAVSQTGDHVSAFYLQCSGETNTWRVAMTTADVNGPGVDSAVSTQKCRSGTWTHLAMVYDADRHEMRLYVNGARAATATHTTTWNATGPLTIGSATWESHGVDYWNGQIDDIQVWNRSLADNELAAIADATVEQASWDLNGSGADDTTYDHPLTPSAEAAWDTGHNGLQAAVFNGTSSYACTAGPVVHTDQSFTVAAWVRLSTAPTGWVTAISQNGTTNSSFVLGSNGSQWAFAVHGADAVGTPAYRIYSAGPVAVGIWTHLAGVYDARTHQIRLYVNGHLAATAENATAYDARTTFDIGRAKWENTWRDWWPGQVDDIRVYLGPADTDITQLASQ